MPVREALKTLAPGGELAAAPELREIKVTIIAQEAPRDEILRRAASLLGCEWVLRRAGSPAWELRRRADVARWLEEWRRAAREGERSARDLQAAYIEQHLETALAELDNPMSPEGERPRGLMNIHLARVVKEFPPATRRGIARHVADVCAVRPGGEAVTSRSPATFRVRDLSPRQRGFLRDYLREHPARDTSPRWTRGTTSFRTQLWSSGE